MAAGNRSEGRGRAQVVTPRTRQVSSKRPRKKKRISPLNALRSVAGLIKPAILIIACVLLIVGYNSLAGSHYFNVRRIEISEVAPAVRGDIERIVRRATASAKLFDVDLAAIRRSVEALPRVRSASVSRVLPDAIVLQVEERVPEVLVRRESGALVWLDADATEVGETLDLVDSKGMSPSGEIPPIARGFAEATRSTGDQAADRERISTYKRLRNELTEGSSPLWDLIDEVDLTYLENVSVRLAKSGVTVVLGTKEFRARLETSLQVLTAIKQGDAEALGRFRVQDPDALLARANSVSFIDASRPDRIVLNFSGSSANKTERKSEAAEAGSSPRASGRGNEQQSRKAAGAPGNQKSVQDARKPSQPQRQQ